MQVSTSFQISKLPYQHNKANMSKENMEGDIQNRKGLHESLNNEFPSNIANSIEKTTNNMPFFDALIFTTNLTMLLSDYSAGKEANSPYMVGNGYNGQPIHTDKLITKKEASNINLDDFLIKALKSFENSINNSKGTVQDSYVSLFNNFSDLKQNYDLQKSEPIYA